MICCWKYPLQVIVIIIFIFLNLNDRSTLRNQLSMNEFYLRKAMQMVIREREME